MLKIFNLNLIQTKNAFQQALTGSQFLVWGKMLFSCSLLRLQYQLLWYNVHAVVKHQLTVTRWGTQIMPLALFVCYSQMWMSLQEAVGCRIRAVHIAKGGATSADEKRLEFCFPCVLACQHHLVVSKGSTWLVPSAWISLILLNNNPA